MSYGKLVLIPTPLDHEIPLESVAHNLLNQSCLKEQTILLIEEHKVARQRWIQWGLPREAIEKFLIFNEHTFESAEPEIITRLKEGKTAYLISDTGLPAFCDPGQTLVKKCHQAGIQVTSTPFSNSIALAVAMSGMDHQKFYFAGFPPADTMERKKELDRLANLKETLVIMDTPYRLKALLSDIGLSRLKNRRFYLATQLNGPKEATYFGDYEGLCRFCEKIQKPEFVLVVSAQ